MAGENSSLGLSRGFIAKKSGYRSDHYGVLVEHAHVATGNNMIASKFLFFRFDINTGSTGCGSSRSGGWSGYCFRLCYRCQWQRQSHYCRQNRY